MPNKIRIPQDPEQMNTDRSEWSREALEAFQRITHMRGEDMNIVLTDLLADFAHFCDCEQIDYAECLRCAANHYEEETGGDGEQFKRIVIIAAALEPHRRDKARPSYFLFVRQ